MNATGCTCPPQYLSGGTFEHQPDCPTRFTIGPTARAEAVLRHHADGPGGAFPDLARDVVALTEELTGLREQLDAARQALQEIVDGDSDDWWAREVARAALGVEGPAG